MTFRQLLANLQEFALSNPDHASLDRQVIVRVGVPNGDDDEDLHLGGLQSAVVDSGCTEEFALVLDADQDPDDAVIEPPDEVAPDPSTPQRDWQEVGVARQHWSVELLDDEWPNSVRLFKRTQGGTVMPAYAPRDIRRLSTIFTRGCCDLKFEYGSRRYWLCHAEGGITIERKGSDGKWRISSGGCCKHVAFDPPHAAERRKAAL